MFSQLRLLAMKIFHLCSECFNVKTGFNLLSPDDFFQLIELFNISNESTDYILNIYRLLMKFNLKSYFRIRSDPMGWRQVGHADLNFLV